MCEAALGIEMKRAALLRREHWKRQLRRARCGLTLLPTAMCIVASPGVRRIAHIQRCGVHGRSCHWSRQDEWTSYWSDRRRSHARAAPARPEFPWMESQLARSIDDRDRWGDAAAPVVPAGGLLSGAAKSFAGGAGGGAASCASAVVGMTSNATKQIAAACGAKKRARATAGTSPTIAERQRTNNRLNIAPTRCWQRNSPNSRLSIRPITMETEHCSPLSRSRGCKSLSLCLRDGGWIPTQPRCSSFRWARPALS